MSDLLHGDGTPVTLPYTADTDEVLWLRVPLPDDAPRFPLRSQRDPETTGSGPYWEVIPDPNSDYPERRGLDPDPDRCPSCGHPADMFCEDLCCLDDHAEAITDV